MDDMRHAPEPPLARHVGVKTKLPVILVLHQQQSVPGYVGKWLVNPVIPAQAGIQNT